jgi:hypothetical protein
MRPLGSSMIDSLLYSTGFRYQIRRLGLGVLVWRHGVKRAQERYYIVIMIQLLAGLFLAMLRQPSLHLTQL